MPNFGFLKLGSSVSSLCNASFVSETSELEQMASSCIPNRTRCNWSLNSGNPSDGLSKLDIKVASNILPDLDR